MDALTFTVPGPPVPQPRPRISTRGGHGRAYTPSDHPIHVYRQAVALAARAEAIRRGHKPTASPVQFVAVCYFARPKSHRKASGELRAGAPAFPPKSDWDNLGKGVSDAITDSGAIWVDDEQVVDGRSIKLYGEPPRTVVTIQEPEPWLIGG